MDFNIMVRCSSATYFVEYQFPAVLLDSKTPSHVHQHVYEVMRVACKRMEQDGSELVSPVLCDAIMSVVVCVEVTFNHRSVFPVLVNSKVLLSWWNNSLIFRVYCRPSHHRMVGGF